MPKQLILFLFSYFVTGIEEFSNIEKWCVNSSYYQFEYVGGRKDFEELIGRHKTPESDKGKNDGIDELADHGTRIVP